MQKNLKMPLNQYILISIYRSNLIHTIYIYLSPIYQNSLIAKRENNLERNERVSRIVGSNFENNVTNK